MSEKPLSSRVYSGILDQLFQPGMSADEIKAAERDIMVYGVYATKDGKRIDPDDIFIAPLP